MAAELQDNFVRQCWNRIRKNSRNVGELRSLLALATGRPVDDLAIFETKGSRVYTLPDYAPVPEDPYVCV